MNIDITCNSIHGSRMQFELNEYPGFNVNNKNVSLCFNIFGELDWLDHNEVYVTDVLSTGNYSWP